MQSNRKRNTKPELLLRRSLHALGLRYRIHTAPQDASKRIADIVFPVERIAVFIDGCFWHGCAIHTKPPRTNSEYWGPKIRGNQERDARTDRELADAGWVSLRIWEHDEPASAARDIEIQVKSRRGVVATLRRTRARPQSARS